MHVPPKVLSVLIPLYNEEEFVASSIQRVLDAQHPASHSFEIVVVDDGSKDDSRKIVNQMAAKHPGIIRLICHEKNQGKGAAIRTAIANAQGEYSVIHDADLEYDPRDFAQLLPPLLDGRADAVFGSRFLNSHERRVLLFWHAQANWVLTTLCNMFADLNLTDMETCYKAARTSLLKSIPIRSNRFGVEPELTIKLSQRKARIYEVPISYHGRSYEEGKKIGLKDAFQALGVILRYGFSRDIYTEAGGQILDTLAQTPRFNKWMADTIRPYVGKRVLEVGAGMGNLTMQLLRGRERYFATDIDEEHLARLHTRFGQRPTLSAHYCDLEKSEGFAPFREQADTVICLNVIEHVADDLGGLRNIHSTLQSGGRAIILTPQGQSIYGTLDEVLGHHRRYSRQELVAKMEQAGFAVEQVLEFNRITWPGWWLNGRVLKRKHFGRFQLAVFDSLVWLWRALDKAIPWPAVSLIAIGRKI